VEAPRAASGASPSRYEILARLATGGMAELYLARATAADGVVSHVVLKRILPSRSHDPQFVTMFLDEAALAAQLHHPNIAQVFDIGRLGSSYFFTMEYVHGENAKAILQREYGLRRKVPVSHAITIAAGAATGLHHAHEAMGSDRRPLNIVHRDVSPANIMISFDGAVKLVDFGVAKAAVRFHETRVGTIKGKIAYLSPEQCTGNRPVDRRSDVFSLGIVLYELLTVERLFRRDSDFATMAAIVTDDVPPPSEVRRDVPPELDTVVMRALEKQPDDRFPTAGALVDALETAANRAGIALSVGGLGSYLRELFGVKPEPWIELESAEAMPTPVTVTGESMIQIPTTATPLGPAATMLSPDGLVPPPVVGEVAEIEAALVRTVRLEPEMQPNDDEFLVAPAVSTPVPGTVGAGVGAGTSTALTPAPAIIPKAKFKKVTTEELEDRPTVIDDRLPEMPSDLELTTPLEAIDPIVTPPTTIAAPPPVEALEPPTFLGQPPMPKQTPRAQPVIAQPVHLPDEDVVEGWTRDTTVEGATHGGDPTTMRRPAVEPGAIVPPADPRSAVHASHGVFAPPAHAAPAANAPLFRLSTKILLAAISLIILALVIRGVTRPDHPAPPKPSPSLPPADPR
jgi:serine/threonine protein kinase